MPAELDRMSPLFYNIKGLIRKRNEFKQFISVFLVFFGFSCYIFYR